jgi:formate-dependent phosphoribosylglycinamide formyltransferase (GAR transformylase)
MPFVIYAVPWFNEVSVRYIEAILSLPDVRLAVIALDPEEKLPPHLRGHLAGHWRLDDMLDSGKLAHAAGNLAQHFGPIHRIFSHQEQFQVPLAQAREWLGITGMGVEAAHNFRDKARMKQVFREAGIPCARGQVVTEEAQAWHFADEVGYPLVLKPVAGAASQGTFRADGAETLREALTATAPGPHQPILVEEFITGEEHSFDSFTIRGETVWHSLTHYHPAPLEVIRTPWIQWSVVLPREVDHPRYDDIREAAARALKVLGMETGISHLEWFRRRDGSIAISEVAARPPGAQITTLMSVANDFDAIRAWVRLMVYEEFDVPPRRYAAGAAYLRGQGQGRIKAVHGLEQAQQELGPLVVAAKLPQVGQHTSTSYEGDGYVIVRHPDTEVVRQALQRLVSLIQVELG